MIKNNEKLFSEFPEITTQQWEDIIKADLKGVEYEKRLIWKTDEGFSIKPYYRSEDLNELEYLNQIPSSYSFARGQKIDNNNWKIVQEINETDPIEANKIALNAINRGADVISFNASKILTSEDISFLLKNIDCETTEIRFKHSSEYSHLIDLFVAELKSQKANLKNIYGSIDFDPICYLLLHNKFYKSSESDFNELINIYNKIDSHLPNFKSITINGQLLHNCGSNIVQEIGYSLAWVSEYLNLALEKGLDITQFANKIFFTLSVGENYFMEIAKLRAFRILYSIIAEQYKVDVTKLEIYIHSEGSKWNKTLYDPNVNMLRSTTEGMAAILGGTNSLYLQSYDLCYKYDDEFSRRISRNIQLILKHESYFDKVVDPSAGSYYIENLTDNFVKESLKLFQNIEKEGGFVKLIENGKIKNDIEKNANKKFNDIAIRKTSILGTNQYPNQNESMLDKYEQCVCDCKNKYEGLQPLRASLPFEKLRQATEKFINDKKRKPTVFLFTIGNLAMRKARATFSSNFFACAGYEIIDNNGFETSEEGIAEAIKSKADIIVICSSDDEYAQFAGIIAKGIKNYDIKKIVVLAGYPQEIIETLREQGVDEFIHVRSNLIETLNKFHKELGIL